MIRVSNEENVGVFTPKPDKGQLKKVPKILHEWRNELVKCDHDGTKIRETDKQGKWLLNHGYDLINS